MCRRKTNLRLCGVLLGLSLVAAASGCHTCNNIAPGAVPPPAGTYDCQWVHAERALAAQDNFVIYQYEWSADGTKLTPSGQEHVAQIGRTLCAAPFPIVIEPSSDRRVDEWRRMAVLDALASSGTPVPPDRVVIRRPGAEGLYGQEAPAAARGMLSNQAGTGGQGTGGAGAALGGTQAITSGSAVGGSGTGVGVGVGTGVY